MSAATVLPNLKTAKAQDGSPVKIGFIEDESGNLSVYGIQKLHAAQLAVKEINEGKTLKGGANIGTGGYGPLASYAANAPTISKEGVALDIVNAGGEMSGDATVFVRGTTMSSSTRAIRAFSAARSTWCRLTARATMRCGSS